MTINSVTYSIKKLETVSRNKTFRSNLDKINTKIFYKRLNQYNVELGSILQCTKSFGVWAHSDSMCKSKRWITMEPNETIFLSTLETTILLDEKHPYYGEQAEPYIVWVNVVTKNCLYKFEAYMIHQQIIKENLIPIISDEN